MIKADMFQIKEEVTKNLLSAHKRIAEEGNAREVIRLSRYLLKLEQKLGDVGTYAIPEKTFAKPPYGFTVPISRAGDKKAR